MELKKVSCDPVCGFSVQGHDDDEIIGIVTAHAKKSHNMMVSASDVKKMMKSA